MGFFLFTRGFVVANIALVVANCVSDSEILKNFVTANLVFVVARPERSEEVLLGETV